LADGRLGAARGCPLVRGELTAKESLRIGGLMLPGYPLVRGGPIANESVGLAA
jgi:hypothetical protein